MNRLIVWKTVVSGLLLLALAVPAQAQMGMMKGGMKGGDDDGKGMMKGMGMAGEMMGGMLDDSHMLWKHLAGLGLDDAQQKKVREIRLEAQKEIIRRKADHQISRIELDDLLKQDQVDLQAVQRKLMENGSIHSSMLFAGIKAREDIKAVLTPEQREKLAAMHKAHGMEHGSMMEGMKCMSGGDADDKAPAKAEEGKKEEPAAAHSAHH